LIENLRRQTSDLSIRAYPQGAVSSRMMHVCLVGDPNKENKMDFSGLMAGYTRYFRTKDQPNKPARSALQA
jgi:hypothetical protein